MDFLERIIYLLVVRFGARVFWPKAGLPHGVTGLDLPIGLLPSPPPWGWSQGFIATPLTLGVLPNQRLQPALPNTIFK